MPPVNGGAGGDALAALQQLLARAVQTLANPIEVKYNEVTAQKRHEPQLEDAKGLWTNIHSNLELTGGMLRDQASTVEPIWGDSAGSLYASRVDQSARSVETRAKQIGDAQVPAALEQAKAAIQPAVTAVEGAKADIEQVVIPDIQQQIAKVQATIAAAGKSAPGLSSMLGWVAQYVKDMDARIAKDAKTAVDAYTALDDAFGHAHRSVTAAGVGSAYEGPLNAGGGPAAPAAPGGPAPSAAPTSAPAGPAAASVGGPPGGTAPGAVPGGAPPGGMGPGAMPGEPAPGAMPGGMGAGAGGLGAGSPSLQGGGLGAVPPVPPSLPPGGLPGGAIPPAASIPPGGPPPVIPPMVPGTGGSVPKVGGASAANLGRLGGAGAIPPMTPAFGTGGALAASSAIGGNAGGPTQIPKAAKTFGAELPPPAQAPHTPASPQAGGAGGPSTAQPTGRGMPPPMMPPPMAGNRGGQGGGDIGDGDGPGSPEKARPQRSVPGVPPRLRGRAGTLDATPAFLGPASRAGAKQAETENSDTVQLLDEELWRVEDSHDAVRSRRSTVVSVPGG